MLLKKKLAPAEGERALHCGGNYFPHRPSPVATAKPTAHAANPPFMLINT